MATYKLDGAKFSSLDELKSSMWDIYQGKMSREEFDKYVEDNVETAE